MPDRVACVMIRSVHCTKLKRSDPIMNKYLRTITACVLCLLGMFRLSVAWGDEDHKAVAMKQATAAYESAKAGDAKAAAEQAAGAKAHAEAALQERANPHLDAAIKNLNLAIEHGRSGDAVAAKDDAHAAMTHLKAAEKAF